MASSTRDDAYEEYLWGEASARSFAQRSRVTRAPVQVRPKRVDDLLRP